MLLYHPSPRKYWPIECAGRHVKVSYAILLFSVLLGRNIHPSTKTVSFIPSLRQVGSSGEKPRKEEGGRGCCFNRFHCILTQHKSQRTCFLPVSMTSCSLSSLPKSLNVSGPCANFIFPSSSLYFSLISSTHIIFPPWKPPCSSGKTLSSQLCLSLGNIFSYLVWRLLKKNKSCSRLPARVAAAIPNLMKDCHQVSKCLSDPKVRRCLICCCKT